MYIHIMRELQKTMNNRLHQFWSRTHTRINQADFPAANSADFFWFNTWLNIVLRSRTRAKQINSCYNNTTELLVSIILDVLSTGGYGHLTFLKIIKLRFKNFLQKTTERPTSFILDHLQDLTLKYAHNNRKTQCFLHVHFYTGCPTSNRIVIGQKLRFSRLIGKFKGSVREK